MGGVSSEGCLNPSGSQLRTDQHTSSSLVQAISEVRSCPGTSSYALARRVTVCCSLDEVLS